VADGHRIVISRIRQSLRIGYRRTGKMMQRLESDLVFAGRCYHSLFLGEDTDEAECAARHTAEMHGLIKAFITSPPKGGA